MSFLVVVNLLTLCIDFMQVGVHLPEEQGPAHLFLAQYYMKMGCFKEAEAHAHKCTNFIKASTINYMVASLTCSVNDHYQLSCILGFRCPFVVNRSLMETHYIQKLILCNILGKKMFVVS